MSRFDALGTANSAAMMQYTHGESVSYTPNGGAAATITAVVIRNPRAILGIDGGRRQGYELEIIVSRADVASVVLGGDTVAVKKFPSDTTATTYTVVQRLSQDGASWHLGLM